MPSIEKILQDGMKRLDNGESKPSQEYMNFVSQYFFDDKDTNNAIARIERGRPKGVVALMDDGKPEAEKINKNAFAKELYISYDTLDKTNKLAALKDKDYTLYAVLYHDKYGKWPNDAKKAIDHNMKAHYQNELHEFKKETLGKMSWDDLTKANLTKLYSELHPDGYAEKFKSKFGKYPLSKEFVITGKEAANRNQ